MDIAHSEAAVACVTANRDALRGQVPIAFVVARTTGLDGAPLGQRLAAPTLAAWRAVMQDL